MVDDHLDMLRRDHEADPDDPLKRQRFVQALKRSQTLPHYALIGNIHGNLEAFHAVLRDVTRRDIPDVLCMGNIFGYGPNPAECLDLVMSRCSIALTGEIEADFLYNSRHRNREESEELRWIRAALQRGSDTEVQRRTDFLHHLQRKIDVKGYCFVYGLPRSPAHGKIQSMSNWSTLENSYIKTFTSFGKCLFVGHTTNPIAVTEDGTSYTPDDLAGRFHYTEVDRKYILGIGSVWDRSSGPAWYAEILGNQLFWHSVTYDNAKTMAKLKLIQN